MVVRSLVVGEGAIEEVVVSVIVEVSVTVTSTGSASLLQPASNTSIIASAPTDMAPCARLLSLRVVILDIDAILNRIEPIIRCDGTSVLPSEDGREGRNSPIRSLKLICQRMTPW